MKLGIVSYPGSHGIRDLSRAYRSFPQAEIVEIPLESKKLGDIDVVLLPGGFSFGDYLRPGAIASAFRVSGMVKQFAAEGGKVLGLGNGFQILCELGVLPGAFLPNPSRQLIHEDVHVTSGTSRSPFLKGIPLDTTFELPLSCECGQYFVDRGTYNDLVENDQVAFRYTDSFGDECSFHNYCTDIAGVINREGNVLGLMPHPEQKRSDFAFLPAILDSAQALG